jgi:hypothetical protein
LWQRKKLVHRDVARPGGPEKGGPVPTEPDEALTKLEPWPESVLAMGVRRSLFLRSF